MKVKLLFGSLIVLLVLFLTNANAQSFAKLESKNGDNPFEDDGLKVFGRFTTVESKYTPNYSGFTLNVALRKDAYEKGEIRTRYDQVLVIFYTL